MSNEAGIEYWSRYSAEELEETRQSLLKDLDAGDTRNGATKQWIDEIDTVLESRKQTA